MVTFLYYLIEFLSKKSELTKIKNKLKINQRINQI